RARDGLPDEQSAVLQMGTGFQGSHDDGGGRRSPGASQCHRGVERGQLPSRGGQTGEVQSELRKQASPAGEQAPWGSGSAPVAVAALRLPPRSQTPTAVRRAGSRGRSNCRSALWASPRSWLISATGGKITVAQGER